MSVLRPLRALSARLLPRGWVDAVRQLVLFAAAYYGYQLVRGAADGHVAAAFWNATKLIWLEHQLHFFVEPSVQAWASSKHWLIDATSWMYLNLHFFITIGALVYLYLFRNRSFYFVRNMFMVSMAIALVGYAVFPTAPPRLMPEWGFTDPVSQLFGIPQNQNPAAALVNMYAAVPSMHVCFALMVGWTLALLVRVRALKALWALYPFLITFVVVATGNHYFMDAIIGGLVAAVSALAARFVLARFRPTAWAFHRQAPPAPARAEAASLGAAGVPA